MNVHVCLKGTYLVDVMDGFFVPRPQVIVLWTANTERYCDVLEGVHDSSDNLLEAIRREHDEISPSTIFAVASILEGVSC